MPFSRNINEIISDLQRDYQNQFPTADTSQGSLIFIKNKAFGAALWSLYEYLEKASRQIFYDTADTDYLEHHCNNWEITRKTEESDASLIERLALRIRRPPAGGNKYDYKRWAESVSGVKKAYVFTPDSELTDPIPLGIVDVVVIADSGSGYTQEVPSETLLASVQTEIDDKRSVAMYFTNITAPKNQLDEAGLFLVNVEVKVNSGNYDRSRLESSIKVYMNALSPNEPLYNDQITSLCIRQGCKSVDVMFSSKVLKSAYKFTSNSNIVTAQNKYSVQAIQLNDTIWPDTESGLLYGAKVIGIDENNLQITLDRNYTGSITNTTEIQKKFTNQVYFTISADDSNIPTYSSVEFDWTSTYQGAIAKRWEWDFGDGETSEEESPIHTYTEEGEYTVSCKILFVNQNKYIESQNQLTINAYGDLTPPNTKFSVDRTGGNNPLTVTFTDESTGDIDLWEWDFGDGSTSNEESPSHTYTATGDYDVTLKTTGSGGTDEMVRSDYISVSATGSSPTARFRVDKRTPKKNEVVSFIDKSIGTVEEWLWDFGDGGQSTEQNPQHVYTQHGKYTVTLTVTDADSQTDDKVKLDNINVSNENFVVVEKEDVIPSNHQLIRFGKLIVNKA